MGRLRCRLITWRILSFKGDNEEKVMEALVCCGCRRRRGGKQQGWHHYGLRPLHAEFYKARNRSCSEAFPGLELEVQEITFPSAGITKTLKLAEDLASFEKFLGMLNDCDVKRAGNLPQCHPSVSCGRIDLLLTALLSFIIDLQVFADIKPLFPGGELRGFELFALEPLANGIR